MEAVPGSTPATDDQTFLGIREAIQDGIDDWLNEEERAIFDAYYVERLTLREIEERYAIPKTTAARHRDQATYILRNVLPHDPRIPMTPQHETWEEAAYGVAGIILHAARSEAFNDYVKFPEPPLAEVGQTIEVLRARIFDNDQLPEEFRDEVDDGSILHGYRALAVLALSAPGVKDTAAHLRRVVELIASKQHDYGHGNIAKFGNHGLVIRLHDKYARLENLVAKGGKAKNESIQDSWDDILGYAIIGMMWELGTFMLPLKRDLH